jgi:hypothetical protein
MNRIRVGVRAKEVEIEPSKIVVCSILRLLELPSIKPPASALRALVKENSLVIALL